MAIARLQERRQAAHNERGHFTKSPEPEAFCGNCHRPYAASRLSLGRCDACAVYIRAHGHERPPRLYRRLRPQGTANERYDILCGKAGADECWTWRGNILPHGYARFRDDVGRWSYVHRFSYERFVGPIPDGLTIDHLCRNRACSNPAHLEAVTDRVNVLRGTGPSARNARKTHCDNGHSYDEDSYMTAKGWRVCRICRRERDRRRRAPGR